MIEKEKKILVVNAGEGAGKILVKALKNYKFRNIICFGDNFSEEENKVFLGDIREKESVDKVVGLADYVFFVPKEMIKDKQANIEYNLGGLCNVLEAAVWRKKPVKVFILSTISGFEQRMAQMTMNLCGFFNSPDITPVLFEGDDHISDIISTL